MLRIGILLDTEEVSAWIADFVDDIIQHKQLQLAVVVIPEQPYRENLSFAYTFFSRIGNALLPGKPNLSKIVKLAISDDARIVKINTPNYDRNSSSPADLTDIINTGPDVLLYFGNRSISGDFLSLAKHGVWCLHTGDGLPLGNKTAGFREWYYKTPMTQISVMKLSSQSKEHDCITSSVTKTEYLSLSRNQTALFSKGINLLIQTLESYASGTKPAPTENPRLVEHAHATPGLWVSLIAFGKLLSRLLTKYITKLLYIEQWVLFYSFSSQAYPSLSFHNFKALVPPKNSIWADPFVVDHNDQLYLFIEELHTKTNKGHISCLTLDNHGEIKSSVVIIDRPYHLSYPFIFQNEGIWYMIPESADNLTVDLFECEEFPAKWKFKKTLLSEIRAFDSTIHYHEGKYWLFCTVQKRPGGSTNDDLYLYYTEDFINGQWHSHVANPVISNPESARPAGKIFYDKNTLYRPSQICVPRYGYGLSLNRIDLLNETCYSETNVNQVIPNWRRKLCSTHTLNFTGNFTIIDGQIRRFRYF